MPADPLKAFALGIFWFAAGGSLSAGVPWYAVAAGALAVLVANRGWPLGPPERWK